MTSCRRSLVALLVVVMASACAVIPSSGPVTKVADDDGLDQSAVRYTPARPLKGASPEQIVRGYLDAMLAFPASSRTASAFLTPEAGRRWTASAQVRIYSAPEVSAVAQSGNRGELRNQPGGPVSVRLGFTDDARLDRQGRYTRRAAPAALTYSLEQVKGEWRIANPQAGTLITRKFFDDYFQPFTLFFFDRPGRRLVPEPVHLLAGDQLATTLVASLAGGPRSDTTQATRTFVPPRRSLRPSVPVSEGGVADVEFTEDFRELSTSARERFSAQVVWTLRQVPGVEAIQILGGATALTAGGDEIQPVQAWGGFGPSTARGRAYAVVDDTVVEVDDGELRPISGTWGQDARGAGSVGVSEAGVAAVLAGGRQVRVTDRAGAKARTIEGTGLLGPDWDSEGNLWLVDRAAGRTRVRIVAGDDQREIAAEGLAGRRISTFELSPDGSRYVVTGTGTDAGQLLVGRVLRDVGDRVLGLSAPEPVYTTAASPRSASWSSGTQLIFLADSQAGVQVYQASIDGSETIGDVARSGALLPPDVEAETLVAGAGTSSVLYVTDRQDRLWFLGPEGDWSQVEGPPVTGLAFGR
jgi:hypothetical protein